MMKALIELARFVLSRQAPLNDIIRHRLDQANKRKVAAAATATSSLSKKGASANVFSAVRGKDWQVASVQTYSLEAPIFKPNFSLQPDTLSQTVEEETQKAREDVRRAIKQRTKQQACSLESRQGKDEQDFDSLFRTGGDASAPDKAVRSAEASSGVLTFGKAVVEVKVQQQQHPQESSNRSSSTKRSDRNQQRRPSSSKSSAKSGEPGASFARPASAPASISTSSAAAADHEDLHALSCAQPEAPVSASQVKTHPPNPEQPP
jgi:hypothetical protein